MRPWYQFWNFNDAQSYISGLIMGLGAGAVALAIVLI